MSYGIGKLGDWPTVITTIKKIIGEYRDLPGKEDVRD